MRAKLARSNRSLQLLTSCHEALIRTTDEKRLIQEICDLAERYGYRQRLYATPRKYRGSD